MIEEQGVVIAVTGRYAQVRTERRGGCGQCAVQDACGTSLLERFFGRRAVALTALNSVNAVVGERVLVGISEQGLLNAALAAYLVPILALIGGAMIGAELGGTQSDLFSALGAVLGLALALLWLRRYSVASARKPDRQPLILRRLDAHSTLVSLPHP